MQIRSEIKGGHCRVDFNGQDKDHKAHTQLIFEKHKLQKTTVVQDIVYTDGHWHGVDLTSKRQLLRNQQHQCLRICWERILPQHCLRVLLVEGDDSTRHVVSSLLWHCSYEVTAVANGLEAWDLLKDPSNHFNMVLTEVAMPCLAGIRLLRKIASHEIYRNIPVIMMSSLDSMSLIFKCLTMGAADFLIKPVRKNELKNIWKHIWKRRQNSMINGCGSSINNCPQKPVRLQLDAGSENKNESNEKSNTVLGARKTQKAVRLQAVSCAGDNTCNYKNENASSDFKVGDDGDKGGGKQTGNEDPEEKGKHEHDQHHIVPISSHTTKPTKKDCQDMFIPLLKTSRQHSNQNLSDGKMGENLEMYLTRQTSPGHQHFQEEIIACNQTFAENKDAPSQGNQDHQMGKSIVITCGHKSAEPYREAIDLIGAISRKNEGRKVEAENDTWEVDKEDNERHKNDDTISDSNFSSLLELNLKRPQPSSGDGIVSENSCVLRQSITSAFSRYNTKCDQLQHPSGGFFPCNTHSSPKDHELNCTMSDLGIKRTGSPYPIISFDRPNRLKRIGIDVSIPPAKQLETSHTVNNQDKGAVISSSGQDNFPFQLQMKDDKESLDGSAHLEMLMPVPLVYGSIPASYGVAFHPMIYSQPNALWKHTTKDQKTQTQNECGISISCSDKQKLMSFETPQSSQHETRHYYLQHHYHCCQSKEKVCLHQHSKHKKQTMNKSVVLEASSCGMYSMVSHNLDRNHQEAGGNGSGSVSKASCVTKNHTNGPNDCYNYLHNKPVHHQQSDKPPHPEGDEQIMNNSRIADLMCCSSNNGQTGSGNVYESLNATEHGKNNRINEQNAHLNAQSHAIFIPTTNGESGSVNGVTHGGATGRGVVNQNHSSQREAALTKFHLKRKERCFEKKVRYQSRKKLAEQRPRVRGQFVRQAAHESRTGDMD